MGSEIGGKLAVTRNVRCESSAHHGERDGECGKIRRTGKMRYNKNVLPNCKLEVP